MQTVLIIDDNAFWRDAAGLYLQEEGFHVLTAGDGREALALLASSPLPTVILLDAAMPDMDGAAFLVQLRADPRLRRVPVLVCSAHSTGLEGADGFLSKQADPVELLQTLCEYVVPGAVPACPLPPQKAGRGDGASPRSDGRHLPPAIPKHF